jgi:hypothetical protein
MAGDIHYTHLCVILMRLGMWGLVMEESEKNFLSFFSFVVKSSLKGSISLGGGGGGGDSLMYVE